MLLVVWGGCRLFAWPILLSCEACISIAANMSSRLTGEGLCAQRMPADECDMLGSPFNRTQRQLGRCHATTHNHNPLPLHWRCPEIHLSSQLELWHSHMLSIIV